ncbi:DNA-directed RNA polymerase I subunit RPA1 [Frankliniella fusca]|uniref:DNA-directed RNA polymerase subunit n=1 Tax=Frankliniella fusca TaxID=407009 RepID=A0AAE1HVW6_9NEOP|nr:DNA-directed RNA polymerase I subunit RPA1 [Frankliniella fusca]
MAPSTNNFDVGRVFDPRKVSFTMFTSDEIRRISAVTIKTPLTLNALGHPVAGGLYDGAMGPMTDTSDPCKTCLKNIFGCPGHIGHIELPVPVSNPLFHKPVSVFMRLACLNCYRLQLNPAIKWQIIAQVRLAEAGFMTDALEVENSCIIKEKKGLTAEVEDAMYKDLVTSYIQTVTSKGNPSIVANDNKAAETVRNYNLNNFLRASCTEKKCMYCKGNLLKFILFRDRLNVRVDVAPKHQQSDESTIPNTSANLSTSIADTSSASGGKKARMQALNPKEIRDHLRKLWVNEKEFMSEIMPVLKHRNIEHPIDIFFFDVIPVPPPNVRPVNLVRGLPCEHPQTGMYKKVVADSVVLWNVIQMVQDASHTLTPEGKLLVQGVQGATPIEKLHFAWEALQLSADHLLDSEHAGVFDQRVQGLKQVLEKKEGVIRMHMMGKRVNFAARSVITPDPNLNVDEIGFPEAFALKLYYPVPVTHWNVKELRQMVRNGPLVHPGAVMVEDEKGFINRLNANNPLQREAIAKRLLTPGDQSQVFNKGMKKVYRHLINGDILLLNRQPTLHRPSIMAHKARILKGEKTLRMHYSNCKSYNADFDGDEMNAHFPQSELARSEAYNLVNVCHQYLVPKDGTPLGGLIQDHMVSGVWLSIRGKFFSREDYCQLVFQAIGDMAGNIKLLHPAVLKPMPLWSGKQVISTVLINTIPKGKPLINLTATAKIRANLWEQETPRPWRAGGTPFGTSNNMSEAEVIIRQGELLSGVLDKTHYGATPYGLVHCMYELYGGECSSRLLSSFAKLFMAFLQQMEGFTLGVEDILVVKKADQRRTEIIQECRRMGNSAAAAALGLAPDTPPDVLTEKMEEAYCNPKRNFRGEIDSQFKSLLNPYTDNINKTCLPGGLLQKFPKNNLQLMVQSGAKGSTVNTMQISGLLGQIELEGKRPPLMISGRSLPSFIPYDRQPRAGGFIDGRFMTGIQPQEFFFHCMAGREGLIDTAVKTSRSGYLQRCLVKNLEGLSIQYDMTVRDSDGSVVQFAYGEDGMDISKVQFLKPEQMSFLDDNHKVLHDQKLLSTLRDEDSFKEISKQKKKVKKWKKAFAGKKARCSTFLNYTVGMTDTFNIKKLSSKTGRKKGLAQLIDVFRETPQSDPEMKKFIVNERAPDPVTGTFSAHSHFGAVTERVEEIIDNYIKTRKINSLSVDDSGFKDMLYLKSMCSLAPAGDPVGLLAAQSVGEPSTQMTLNTFHFAGRGEMNVTLGIPRLKEILMTASKNISTPSMEIPFRKDVSNLRVESENLKGKLTKITVADLLEYVQVTESLVLSPVRAHQYIMKMQFLPHKFYKEMFFTTPDAVLKHVEKYFLASLDFHIKKLIQASGRTTSIEDQVRKLAEKPKRGKKEASVPEEDNEEIEFSEAAKAGTGEGHESSDEEAQGDDDDATAASQRKKHQDCANYSDDSDADSSDNEARGFIQQEEKNHEEIALNELMCLSKYSYIDEYSYDKKRKEWCVIKISINVPSKKLNLSVLVQEVARLSAVSQVRGLKRAFLLNNPRDGLVLKTDGLNIIEMFKHSDLLDLNKLYSNDIHAISEIYGIEAAVRVLVKEIQDVFKVYGITVDPRHLMLIADFMTFSGIFSPMNRTGLDNNPSSLQKMSFEAPIGFLKKSLWLGKSDSLESPSSRICVGRPCRSGTGAFQLRHQIH